MTHNTAVAPPKNAAREQDRLVALVPSVHTRPRQIEMDRRTVLVHGGVAAAWQFARCARAGRSERIRIPILCTDRAR